LLLEAPSNESFLPFEFGSKKRQTPRERANESWRSANREKLMRREATPSTPAYHASNNSNDDEKNVTLETEATVPPKLSRGKQRLARLERERKQKEDMDTNASPSISTPLSSSSENAKKVYTVAGPPAASRTSNDRDNNDNDGDMDDKKRAPKSIKKDKNDIGLGLGSLKKIQRLVVCHCPHHCVSSLRLTHTVGLVIGIGD
jgi:hypothetical protein